MIRYSERLLGDRVLRCAHKWPEGARCSAMPEDHVHVLGGCCSNGNQERHHAWEPDKKAVREARRSLRAVRDILRQETTP